MDDQKHSPIKAGSEKAVVPRLATRIRVAGFLALWLMEGVWNGIQMLFFFVARKRVRRRMYARILKDSEPANFREG